MAVRLQEVNEKLHRLNRELDAPGGRAHPPSCCCSLCNALDLRDTDTQWHSRRVALYAPPAGRRAGAAGGGAA
ncbi:MAG: hypothetical protein M0C28_11280 [Candidatus Moduliflexus flocculans]|nr:hypothetical protein [Candidatus Moduliflexus flocculans]